MKTITTNNLFWDCECETNYIHLRDAKHGFCHLCNAHAEDQPNSRHDEILSLLIGKTVAARPDYVKEGDAPIIFSPDHIDTSHEETDEDVLWDRERNSWATPKYAFENMIN